LVRWKYNSTRKKVAKTRLRLGPFSLTRSACGPCAASSLQAALTRRQPTVRLEKGREQKQERQ
jgi:hypothetical protein